MLMQAYRRAHSADGQKGRLSQEGLLRLMGQVDPIYLERYNHSTVARWESGATRPTKERLEVFGRALNLSAAEIEGMVWLAGHYDEDESPHPAESVSKLADKVETEQSPETAVQVGGSPSHTSQAARYVFAKFAIPGLFVAVVGYTLSRLGWNAGWIMSLYVILAVALVMVQGFLRVRRSHELREIYFITAFFLLSGNLVQAPVIRMDPYGFYAIENFANTPLPYLLSTIVNIVLALAAGLMFDFLWRWQYDSGRGFGNPCHRAAWTAFPPLVLLFLFALFFSSMGMWIYLLLVLSIMGGTFTTILVIRDKDLSFQRWEKRVMLQTALAVSLVLIAIGAASILILYLQPSPLAIPDHTLVRSWDIDFAALEYSPDELLERYRIAAVLSSLATMIYMILVLGGTLLATIVRIDVGDSPDLELEKAAAAKVSKERLPRKMPPIEALHRPGWLLRNFHAYIFTRGGRQFED